MEGGYDPDSRRCFDWEESHWDRAVMQEIKKLLALKQKPVLRYGTVKIKEEEKMLFVERKYKKDRVILRINLTNQRQQGIGRVHAEMGQRRRDDGRGQAVRGQ